VTIGHSRDPSRDPKNPKPSPESRPQSPAVKSPEKDVGNAVQRRLPAWIRLFCGDRPIPMPRPCSMSRRSPTQIRRPGFDSPVLSESDAATLFASPALPSSAPDTRPPASPPRARPKITAASLTVPFCPTARSWADVTKIEKPIGEGGMGAVYKAKDLALERLVALKVIRPELAGNPDILARFKQEILLASKVTHRM